MAERSPSKQITVRFDLKDWIQILQEAESEGIKPVQFIRSTILKRLNAYHEHTEPLVNFYSKWSANDEQNSPNFTSIDGDDSSEKINEILNKILK